MTGATGLELVALDPGEYLTGDDVIDVDHPSIQAQAAELRAGHPDDVDFARAAFEHVRDEVRHSMDVRDPRVTLTASEVLAQGVGLCYAKSHLLTALLRAEGIPAGLCYQAFTDDGESYTLHGLVAVHLRGRWHRQDPRGNKAGVDAQFRLDAEQLAWPVDARRGERDYPQVHVRPSVNVVRALRRATDVVVLAGGGLPSEP
jgi:transglutaminase-like putative cysteine protease